MAADVLHSDFREFLADAKAHGYGSEYAAQNLLERPLGGYELTYTDGDWAYQDQWEGGEPYAGREQISVKDPSDGLWLPIWSMEYRGEALKEDFIPRVPEWLSKVLGNPDPDLPIRGPKYFRYGKESYQFELPHMSVTPHRVLENFTASERIGNDSGTILYVAKFMGGLTNVSNWPDRNDQFWMESKNG